MGDTAAIKLQTKRQMNTEIKVTHNGTEVTYDENSNVWRFTLRGINRHAETLAKAREAIDKIPKKKSTFKRFDAFLWPRWGKPTLVTVTSINAGPSHNRPEVFVVFKDDREGLKRAKAYTDDIFPCDGLVNGQVHDWRCLQKQTEEIIRKQSAIRSSLTPYKPELEEE